MAATKTPPISVRSAQRLLHQVHPEGIVLLEEETGEWTATALVGNPFKPIFRVEGHKKAHALTGLIVKLLLLVHKEGERVA
jgi:hypothetical protein